MVRCGCASDTCSCTIVPGDGVSIAGAGSPKNPYVVTADVASIDTGIDIQGNNAPKVTKAGILDFQGAGVTVTPGGLDEAIVTIPGATGGSGDSIPPGTMVMFGGVAAPTGWLLCNGASYTVAAYPNLAAALGTRFGGDASNFNVPNMADTFPVGASATKPAGTKGGSATKTIGTANLPPHAHAMAHYHSFTFQYASAPSGSGTRVTDIANKTGAGGTQATAATSGSSAPNTSNTGGGVPLDVLPPYIPLTFIIKT